MLLNQILVDYGPETNEARSILRQSLLNTLNEFWPEDPNHAKNWLPSPKDAVFHLMARFYGPESQLIDGSCPMPRPVRVKK